MLVGLKKQDKIVLTLALERIPVNAQLAKKMNIWIIDKINQEFSLEIQMTRLISNHPALDTLCEDSAPWNLYYAEKKEKKTKERKLATRWMVLISANCSRLDDLESQVEDNLSCKGSMCMIAESQHKLDGIQSSSQSVMKLLKHAFSGDLSCSTFGH